MEIRQRIAKSILLLLMLVPLFACARTRPGGPLVSYEYELQNYRSGYPTVSYQLVMSASGTQTLNYSKRDGVIHSLVLQEDALGKIDLLMKKYRLYRLKESYRPRMKILDGKHWSVRFSYQSDSICSRGSNAYPRARLRSGIDAINAYLDSLIPTE